MAIIGCRGAGRGQFLSPQGIATDARSAFYIVEQGNSRVQKFSAQGALELIFGRGGHGEGELRSPTGIAVAPGSGDIYVADTGNSRVLRFDAEGNFLSTLGAAGGLLHVEHPAWWPYVGCAAVGFASVVAATGAPFRAARRSERVYAVGAVLAAGGWLTAAVRLGPLTDPLPTVLGLLVLVGGLPWWTHRRRRMRVTVDRTIQAWPNIAEQVGLGGSRDAQAA